MSKLSQACLGSVNATESSTSYGTTGVANNLLATATTLRAGDSSLTSTSSLTYDPFGNVLTATDPLGNTTRYRYDTMRELVGVVGPNPNGAGQTLNRAFRITYGNLDGLQTLVERGTVASQSDADWANFSTLAQQATTYDGIDRAATIALSSGGTTTSLVQYSYDAGNRLTCSAQRMNPAAFTSLPASACTLGTLGTYGYDRITMASYDAANRPLSSISGYGTSSQRTDETVTYGKDGEILTQADAKGNLTTLSHNPFNWVYRIYYPTPSNGAVSSTTDYEQYSYDTNGNLTQDRRRDGSVINYGYDANNLRISGANGATFNYDNIRRMTSAVVNGLTTTFTYDALGRVVTEAEPLGNVLSQYDAAGNLTKLTWPDGFYETYGYDSEGELQNVVESTGYAPTAYYYDSLGRPSAIGRSNQTDTYYTYGSNMALSALTQSIGSNSVTYNYTYNPAGQVISSTTTQPAYDWVSGTQIDRSYAVDGQNKYTTSGTASLSYDGRGNLTSDSVTSYAYDVNNHLTNLSTGATLTYDALQRLYEVVGSSTTLFVYAGSQIIAEYDGSENLLRRYAPGPSQEPVAVWYEGTDTATRRRLVEDRLGSTIGITTEAGALLAINTYDEFGIPAAGESGRFQFQGMVWIPEAGLYQTPGRSYSPTLGRFMQADPIGYGDGMNFYNFVHSDPINGADPSGLDDDTAVQANAPISQIDVIAKKLHYEWFSRYLQPISDTDSVGTTVTGGNGSEITVTGRRPMRQSNFNLPPCGNGTAATIADWADKISVGTGLVAVTSGALGLITAPSGAGFVGFETVAVLSGGASALASGVGAVAHFANGDYVGAALDAGGIIGGFAAGKLAGGAIASTRTFNNLTASQARQVNLINNATGTTIGAASSLYSCQR